MKLLHIALRLRELLDCHGLGGAGFEARNPSRETLEVGELLTTRF